MIGSWAYIVPISRVGDPGCMCCWVVVNECFGPEWGKWYLVEIETAVDFLVG